MLESEIPMVNPGGESTMLGHWRIVLRQAEEAARVGRFQEAYALASRPDVADHHHAVQFRSRLALDLIARASRRGAVDDLAGAIEDLDLAERMGAPPDSLAAARLSLADRVAEEVRSDLDAGDPARALERIEDLARHKISGPALRRTREIAEAWQSASADGRLGEFGRAQEQLDRAERLAVVTAAGVFVVDKGDVVVRRSPVFDPILHIADVSFAGVRIADDARMHVDAEKARHVALTGMAITTVGACQRILDLVLEHVKQRQQFGVAIGSFQAVQHKAVDMHVATERARALSYFAALTIAADDPRRRLAAAMAKASAGEAQAVLFRHGLQLFGAMGFTWENDLQFALKRAKAGELLLGGAAEHRAMIAEEFNAADF